MMTIEEYDKQMEIYAEQLKETDEDDPLYEEVSEFQRKYMNQVLNELEKKINESEAMQAVYDLLEYAITQSQSGSSVIHGLSKETAYEFDEIYDQYIGEYILDAVEIYEEEDGWVLDAMFAGNYVPYWNGWWD